ncbi:copper-translocating P-type ATPase [Candidatus Woesearchaeota archaeon]|nr:copper-translocating P-type ATPase [Candidatus Woesearchaeota archaeon]
MKSSLRISGMHCASCSALITRALTKVDGVKSATVNYSTEKAAVEFDEKKTSEEKLIEAVKGKGYGASVIREGAAEDGIAKKEEIRALRNKVIISSVLSVPALIIGMFLMESLPFAIYILWLLSTPIQFYIGWSFYVGTWSALKNRSANMDTLIALGTSAAYFYSAYVALFDPMGHQYFEISAVLITLVLVGKYLEAIAKGRTSEAISKLMKIGAKTATIIKNGKEIQIPIDDVKKGDKIIVKPGQKIPVDGVIIEGHSSIDESMVTGESMPVGKGKGQEVIGSTINKQGSFIMQATKVGSETTLSRIIKLIEEAQTRKAPIQRFADSISAYFVPIVIIIAVLTFLNWIFIASQPLGFAIITAVAVLVIACPCALGLATPTAIMVGTGIGASHGILIKGGDALETANKVKYVIFDKTGTITKGKPEVTDIIVKGAKSEKELLEIAGSIENSSEHPLADAIVQKAKEKKIVFRKASSFSAVAGKGVAAKLGSKQYSIGNLRLMKEKKADVSGIMEQIGKLESEGKTAMIVSQDRKVLGIIAVADEIKEDSSEAVRALKKIGVVPYMITGDNERTAAAIAKKAGIENYFAEVMPEDKANYVKKLQKKGKVAMVGDGINDAPALAQADIGIAMGSGTDVAMETGNIVLMRDSLLDVPKSIKLSKLTMAKIKQGMFWALIYNILGIPIAAGVLYPFTGWLLSPIIAGGAMALSSVSVVTNALLLKAKRL